MATYWAASPTTINGYPIIESSPHHGNIGTLDGHVILVDRGANTYQRYVTAWLPLDNDQWGMGNYIEDFKAAVDDFNRRTTRGY